MTKKDTTIIKGVAILLMLWLHLFNNMQNVDLCENLIYIGGVPISHLLARICGPVECFLFLSGYGLFYVYKAGRNSNFNRIFKLYSPYLVTVTSFILLGNFIHKGTFNTSFSVLFQNLTGYTYTYNGTLWFFLPYVASMLIMPYIFKLTEKMGGVLLLILSLLFVLSVDVCIKKWGLFLYAHLWIYRPLLIISFIAQMLIGSLMLKTNYIEWFKNAFYGHRLLLITLFICSTVGGIFFNFKIYHFCYIIFLIPTICTFRRWEWVNKLLVSLGNNSMIMWLCHAFYYQIILHNFLFSLKYPIIIFLTLTVLSYMTSVILSKPSRILENIFYYLFNRYRIVYKVK